jgi:hypothetical protein
VPKKEGTWRAKAPYPYRKPKSFKEKYQVDFAQHRPMDSAMLGYSFKDRPRQAVAEDTPTYAYPMDLIPLSHNNDQADADEATEPTQSYSSETTPSSIADNEYSFSSCSMTPESVDESNEILAYIDGHASNLAELVLQKLYIVYDTFSGQFTCTTHTDTPSSSACVQFRLSGSGSQGNNGSNDKKRGLGREDVSGNGEEASEEDDRKRPKRRVLKAEKAEYTGPSFACVFLKHKIAQYVHWESCRDKSFPTVHRMK